MRCGCCAFASRSHRLGTRGFFFLRASSVDGSAVRSRDAGGSGKPVYGTRADRGHAGLGDREKTQTEGRGGYWNHPRRDVRCLAQAALVARQGRARIRAGPHFSWSAHRRRGRRYFQLAVVLRHGHQRRAQRVPPPQFGGGVTHREVSKVGSPLPTRFLASRGRAERQCRRTRARDGVGKKSEKGVAFSARWREIFPRAGYYVFLLGRASCVFRHFRVR